MSRVVRCSHWYVVPYAINFADKSSTHCLKHDNGDFALRELRFIATYLINKTEPNHKLYPTKTIINRRLYFNCSVLYVAFGRDIMYPVLFMG